MYDHADQSVAVIEKGNFPMKICAAGIARLSGCKGRKFAGMYGGGDIGSNGGVLRLYPLCAN